MVLSRAMRFVDPPASCPTSCNDGDACTMNVLSGSAAMCNAVCTYPPITACVNGDGCCPMGCMYAADNDCPPPPPTTLDQRLVTVDVTTPAGVASGDSNWRIWALGSLGISPVYTVPFADCGTPVGYTTGSYAAPRARVARLDKDDKLVATYDLGVFIMRGLAAEGDGHWGALLWDYKGADSPMNQMVVRRYDKDANQMFSTALDNSNVGPTDFGIGESRLEFGAGKYSAYYHVHGTNMNYFAYGHEGDQLIHVAAATGAQTNGWTWGCSHSMSELLRFSPAAGITLPICATDCYPGTTGSNFSTDSIGGIYLNNNERKVRDFNAGCNGKVATELGSAAPAAAGWKLVFNGHQNAAVKGQNSYNTSTMNQDIGFVGIANDKTLGPIVWLTNTTGVNEANSSIARWQPSGDATEQYVVGWTSAPTGGTYYLGRVGASGNFLEGPLTIATAKWGRRDDPFRVHLNGDVVWAWFDSAGSTTLKFARLKSGGSAMCSML
ncbi:MAG: hypothetical protein IPM54_12570 [Polyangiaceae bacterium]|nr:hypothetical protein [Polyangiaceae bacterium]